MTFTDIQKAELKKPLDPKNVKPPAPGKHGDYVEGWHVIAEANRIFGFDGWSRETVEMMETSRTENGGKWFVSYVGKVKISAGGIVREGTGCGSGDGMRSLGDAIESAIKEAETDAMKRALMTFGNPFGLALYDKSKANVQAPPIELITDDQRDELAAMAQGAGVALQDICKAANVESLKALPAAKYESVRKKLSLTIEKNASGERKAA